MSIPEAQLETWSHQGSVTQSKNTYATVKKALEDPKAKYAGRTYKVFLQGSYCNDTNIYAESDVDIVMLYEGAWFKDLSELPADQVAAYNSYYGLGTYPYAQFKKEVQEQLESSFPGSVSSGKKALKIAPGGARRSCDVVVAFRYRRYFRFKSGFDERFAQGISLFMSNGDLIANYPEQHSENCTRKHKETANNFKPLVRIFKNMRSKLESDGTLKPGMAPSYFIEGLLYNVPPENFTGSYEDMVLNILKWLYATTDRSKLLCANEQYYLLYDNDPACWPVVNGNKYIDSVIGLWNNWK